MTALAAATGAYPARRGAQGIWRIAWRNLWRNRRRTWLTSGGIAFAVWMLVFARSMQDGTFELMVDNGARLLLGHAQLQHEGFRDDARIELTLGDVAATLAALEQDPRVAMAAPRAQAFALVSHSERAFGAQVLGVAPERERVWSTLPATADAGRYLEGPGEAFVGAVLARNLGVDVGGEIVYLGTAKEGGVAAGVARVVGTFRTGHPDLDRGLVEVDIGDFRDAWALDADEAHAIVITTTSVAASRDVVADLGDRGRVALDWTDLMPEAVQSMEFKQIGTELFFAVLAIIVTFSVVNTFMMTIFERTPELGMLMAIGMRPAAIMRQLQAEALLLAVIGIGIGLVLALALLLPLARFGMPLPGGVPDDLLARYNLPDRVYPTFSIVAALIAAAIMVVGTAFAALVPSLRIRRMRPVDAIRARE